MKLLFTLLKLALLVYGLGLVLLYFIQERLIFFPEKLEKNTVFSFDQPFTEMNFTTSSGNRLHGILFKADSSKGLIFYLHGNAGSLSSWGQIANVYTALGYDLFMLDYPGYGKSEGAISGEQRLHKDIRLVYDSLKSVYQEKAIIILGYSIGTGPAARLASESRAKHLILQAPYYSLLHVMRNSYPFLPAFILKYRFETNKSLPACTMPITIFHGDEDGVIDYRNSLKLKPLLKSTDTLIVLKGEGHNGMSDDPEYRRALRTILMR